MKTTSLGEPGARERRVDAREADLERQRDVVGEDERRRAGAALAAVDRDEVEAARRSLAMQLGQRRPRTPARRRPT